MVIPLATGICLGEYFSGALQPLWSLGAILLLLSVLLVLISFFIRQYSCRWFWGTGISLFFFSIGILLTVRTAERILLNEKNDARLYVGRVSGNPREKSRTIAYPVRVIECRDSLRSRPGNFDILLYLPKDSFSRDVGWGDYLQFLSRISPPHNSGNPHEFDYAAYLFHQGVGGISWAKPIEWKKISGPAVFDLRQKADACRTKILDVFRRLGFTGDELAVLSALTVGYKEGLSDEVRQAFSASGVSHVLALSGLHIGFIYLLLNFLLAWTDPIGGCRAAKPFIVVACLWIFAFVTGLSPSVVRATLMFSLLALSTFFGGRSVSLNTLAVAAFFMLLFNPFYLFDVSFQLSFVSVAGIVIIQPWLYRKWVPANRLLRYVWGMITVTVAAQIVTSTLVLYYFSGFPVHFLWVNLLVIPLVTLILYLAAGMLLMSCFPILQQLFAGILKKLLEGLNALTSFVERLPLSTIQDLYLNKVHVFGFFLLLILFSMYFAGKNKRYLFAAVSGLLILILFHLQENTLRIISPSIVFYNYRTAPCVHFISSGENSYLLFSRKDQSVGNIKPVVSRFWLYHRISEPTVLPENYTSERIINQDGLICFSGKRVCMLKDDRWRNKSSVNPLTVDYLYICRGYNGHIGELTKLFAICKVVLDSSLPEYRLEKLKKECRGLGLDFISISEKGSYRIDF